MSNIDSLQKPQTFFYLSLLRVVAAFGIVILHTYYVYVSYFDATMTQKVISYSLRNLMMWAVPVFVMVTGALLLEKAREVTLRKLFSKYILRAALAIVIFTLVFYIYDLALSGGPVGTGNLVEYLKKVYTDGSWTHMWYLYMLIGLYLLMPAYRKVAAGMTDTEIRYLLLVGLLFMLVLPNVETITGLKSGFYIGVYTVYPFYLFLGYALHQEILRLPKWLAGVMGLLAAAIIIVMTAVQVTTGNEGMKRLLTNYSFVVIGALSVSVYSLLNTDKSPKSRALEKVVLFLDRQSFGVYLLHFMVLKTAVLVLKWNPYPHGGNGMLFLVSILVFGISVLVTFLLRMIPGVKKVL